jgi:hypothetical protein
MGFQILTYEIDYPKDLELNGIMNAKVPSEL